MAHSPVSPVPFFALFAFAECPLLPGTPGARGELAGFALLGLEQQRADAIGRRLVVVADLLEERSQRVHILVAETAGTPAIRTLDLPNAH
ncbi:MAG: hypothetical protein M3483_02230, partial [Gemmatimonadota bacterium]|nr:hypothetical protein [Gemmatimonadota bacterium]